MTPAVTQTVSTMVGVLLAQPVALAAFVISMGVILAGGSVLANLYANLGRFGRHSAVRDLLAYGPPDAWRQGPVLAEADYPDVLVARAVTLAGVVLMELLNRRVRSVDDLSMATNLPILATVPAHNGRESLRQLAHAPTRPAARPYRRGHDHGHRTPPHSRNPVRERVAVDQEQLARRERMIF